MTGNAELEHYGVTDRIVPGALVLDVGASTGQFAWPAVLAGAQVVAVEPYPPNAAILRAIERTVTPRLAVLEAAVGAFCGIRSLVVPGDPHVAATGCYVTGPAAGPPYVPALTLDALIMLADEWDVVKVDVEGAEYDAFREAGHVLSRVRCFTIDTHRWTTGDEPRVNGVGHHDTGWSYTPYSLERLAEKLEGTHKVTALGPFEPGVTLLAVRE